MPSVTVSTYINLEEYEQLNKLIEKGLYKNRSDFIRNCIRKRLEQHKNEFTS